MKHSTEYLFDQPRAAYEPEQTIVATKKIRDARILLKKLSKLKNTTSKEDIPEMIKRYQATKKSIIHWENILNEE